MSLVLDTNVNSLVAQNALTNSGTQLANALEQLSTGLRINTAADDPAGYAIVNGMTSQVNGLNQAAQNANDGVSLTQTANGALNEVTNDLQAMRDLAVESLNATNSAGDRADLNQQYQQLSADIDNVAKTTAFNGVNLLDGTFNGATFQIGANSGQTIVVSSVASARTSSLGASYSASVTSGVTTAALAANDLSINGAAINASVAGSANGQDTSSAYSIAAAINASQDTVTATANATSVTGVAATTFLLIADGGITVNGVDAGPVAAGGSAAGQATNVAAAINSVSAASGVTASLNGSVITLTAADGRNIDLGGTSSTAQTGLVLSGATATTTGTISLSTTATAGIVVGGTTPSVAGLSTGTTTTKLTGTAISNTDVTSVATSNTALTTIDAAIQQLAATGAQLGAYQARFQATVAGLQTTSTNLSSARSGIQDTDYAAATSQLTTAQILQQAGTAMVAQANTIPQNVLTLLQHLA